MSNSTNTPSTSIKQGTNALLHVRFRGLNLDDVDHIDFIIQQCHGGVTWEFSYPSETASRVSGTDDVVGIVWRESDTWKFDRTHQVNMDTKIYYKDSWQNPSTPIISFRLDKTLFEPDVEPEVDVND